MGESTSASCFSRWMMKAFAVKSFVGNPSSWHCRKHTRWHPNRRWRYGRLPMNLSSCPPSTRRPACTGKVMDICRQAGFAPRAVQKDVGLMQTIIGLVAGEIGVALVPASLRNLNRKGVVYREVRDFTPTVEMSVMWRRDNTRPVLTSFLQVVDDVAKSDQEEALAASV